MTHHENHRKPEPEDLVDDRPKHLKQAVPAHHKKFGIEYYFRWSGEWGCPQWYATEKARDQALEDVVRHTSNSLKEHGHEPKYRKINR